MALDGAFLRHLKKEIENELLNSRIDKINQINKDELVFIFRTHKGSKRLLISSRADSGRINFTEKHIENPKNPTMLCMLMRKKLGGAKLIEVEQVDLDRVLNLKFKTYNTIGDITQFTLVVEIMGKHSNAILVDENGNIVDSLKRVGADMSSVRLVLPGIKYALPPSQDKLSLLETDCKVIAESILKKHNVSSKTIAECALMTIRGISPVVSREIEFMYEQTNNLTSILEQLKQKVVNISGEPYIVTDNNNKFIEFSFWEIHQYGNYATCHKVKSFSLLLDNFFSVRDDENRMKSRSFELQKKLSNIRERLNRKISIQTSELQKSKNREQIRMKADIISANISNIKKGSLFLETENFYDNMKIIKIPLDPALSATQNAQKYYKKYKKATTAEKILKEELQKAQTELEYIESVIDALSRASTNDEVAEIYYELYTQKYIKRIPTKKKTKETFSPLRFLTEDNYEITVGRNNKENDKLTLKRAKKLDLWFHVKNIAGSHVILTVDERTTSEDAIYQAACLAAKNSKAKSSSKVAVDFTTVKNVKKPQGAKPGMVIYVNYKTIFVNPQDDLKCKKI